MSRGERPPCQPNVNIIKSASLPWGAPPPTSHKSNYATQVGELFPLRQNGQGIKKAWALRNRIRAYLLSVRPRFQKSNRPTEALFLSKNGTRLTPRSIERLLEKYVLELGLPPYSPHSLRHGAATKLLDYDVGLKTLSEILGHASAAGTATIYVHTEEKKKAAAMAKVL